MRFKLVLLVQEKSHSSILPVSYQYELSSCIHRKLMQNTDAYGMWRQLNGFAETPTTKHRLISISNLYIPKIKVEGDRLHILTKRVQLWISLLPERGTHEFIHSVFTDQLLTIGDKHSQVEFKVESIVERQIEPMQQSQSYISLSPIVFINSRTNKSIEYLAPNHPDYTKYLQTNLLEKYKHFYGKEFDQDPTCHIELLSEPKRKGIFIKRFTPYECKVIGYMYKFQLTAHPILQNLLYNTGMGDKVNIGFGCIEILNTD